MISIITIVKNDRRIKILLEKLIEIPKPEKVEIIIIDGSEGNLDDIKGFFPSIRWIYYVASLGTVKQEIYAKIREINSLRRVIDIHMLIYQNLTKCIN